MQDKTVQTAQGEVAYSALGSGDVIVLLPGFQSDRNGWVRSGYPDLLSDYRLLSIDPIGHGASSKPHDEPAYSQQAVVGHVCAVLDAEEVERAHIWGFSRGGTIAGLCSELAPDRCRSAVMGGTPLGPAVNVTSPMLDKGEPFLAVGDWAGYWANYPAPLPQTLTQHFEATNDPIANAAAIRAMAHWREDNPDLGLKSGSVPRLSYFGSGEVFANQLRDAVATAPIQSHEGAWAGHAETMMDAKGVVEVVSQFFSSLPDESE